MSHGISFFRSVAALPFLVFLFLAAIPLMWGVSSFHPFFHMVCHQIEGRCFSSDLGVMSLCHRCTGVYLGIAIGVMMMPKAIRQKMMLFFIVAVGLNALQWALELISGIALSENTHILLRFSLGIYLGLSISPFYTQAFYSLWSDYFEPHAKKT